MNETEKFLKHNQTNRIEITNYRREQIRIDKQRKSEMKMHRNQTMRFRAKYAKHRPYSGSVTEAADIKMYETHNPGFCYKRNGEHKIPQTDTDTPSMDFQQIRSLLFSDEEVDIEKILCLHMLSTHRLEALKIPPKQKYSDNENCPIERLIERSKYKDRSEIKNIFCLEKWLPLYIIDFGDTQKSSVCTKILEDESLAEKLLVNRQISKLIHSTIVALQNAKSQKLDTLKERARDVEYLKKIFLKQRIKNFVNLLHNYSIISSSESYYLMPKRNFKPICIEHIKQTKNLGKLLKTIYYNVLQVPVKKQWKNIYEQPDLDQEEEDEEEMGTELNFLSHTHFAGRKFSRIGYLDKMENKIAGTESVMTASTVRRKFEDHANLSTLRKLSIPQPRNFIVKNIKDVKSEMTRYLFENDTTNLPLTHDPMNFDKSKNLKMVKSEIKNTNESDGQQKSMVTNERNSLSSKENEENIKSFIKRTTCSACMEKWKIPLPSPKVSNYNKFARALRANPLNRLSAIISKESHILNSYDNKYSSENFVFPKSSHADEKGFLGLKEIKIDSVKISLSDLAKISQEITASETANKLKQFLNQNV